MTEPLPILVAGAGIAGLTVALALARTGHRVIVLEKRTQVEDAGAGIQLSPNASRVLIGLGLGPALARAAGEPEVLVVRRWSDGRRLGGMPLGRVMRERFGAPYYVVHRAELQTLLLDAVRGESQIRLAFGRSIMAARTVGNRVEAESEGASGRERWAGACLVGADGLWSRVAALTDDGSEASFTGFVAWRGCVPAERVPALVRRSETGLWLGPDAHFVHYPVRGGRSVNVVGIVRDSDAERGWSRPGDADTVRSRFRGWSGELQPLIEAVPDWRVWSLFDRAPRRNWVRGRIALAGDAAHPMLPFLAQGGACAIEDAAVLAHALAGDTADYPARLRAYQAERRPRAAAIHAAARRNGVIYHMAGPLALARDLAMTRIDGTRLLDRYGWLYAWTPKSS